MLYSPSDMTYSDSCCLTIEEKEEMDALYRSWAKSYVATFLKDDETVRVEVHPTHTCIHTDLCAIIFLALLRSDCGCIDQTREDHLQYIIIDKQVYTYLCSDHEKSEICRQIVTSHGCDYEAVPTFSSEEWLVNITLKEILEDTIILTHYDVVCEATNDVVVHCKCLAKRSH